MTALEQLYAMTDEVRQRLEAKLALRKAGGGKKGRAKKQVHRKAPKGKK